MEKFDSRFTNYTLEEHTDDESSIRKPSGRPITKAMLDINMEQEYLDKLREQREKIERITREYVILNEEMSDKDALIETLNKKVAQLDKVAVFKKKSEDQSREIKALQLINDKLKSEMQTIVSELKSLKLQRSQSNKEIKCYLSDTKYKFKQEVIELRETIEQKQKQIELWKNKYDSISMSLKKENQTEKHKIDKLNTEIAELREEYDYKVKQTNQIIRKNADQNNLLQEQLKVCKQQIRLLKQQLQEKEESAFLMEQDFSNLILKVKQQNKSVKAEVNQKRRQINECKEELNKANLKIKTLQKNIVDLQEQITTLKAQFLNGVQQRQFDFQMERKQYSELAQVLRKNIDELTVEKGKIVNENKKLKCYMKQKETEEGIIKKTVRIEHNQIDRLERLFDKL